MDQKVDAFLDGLEEDITKREQHESEVGRRWAERQTRRKSRTRRALDPLIRQIAPRAAKADPHLRAVLARPEWARLVALGRRSRLAYPDGIRMAPGYVPLPALYVTEERRSQACFAGEMTGVDVFYWPIYFWQIGAKVSLTRFGIAKFVTNAYWPQGIAALSSLAELAEEAPWTTALDVDRGRDLAVCAMRLIEIVEDGSLLRRAAEEVARQVRRR